MGKRRTDAPLAGPDLSQLIADYYQEEFRSAGRGEAFDRWLTPVLTVLKETHHAGADPAFLLHVLVCTKFRGVTPYAAGSEALAALSPKERALLVGGLRLLQRLGLAWWREVLGPEPAPEAPVVLNGVDRALTMLTGGAIMTPAFEIAGATTPLGPRQDQAALTACMHCCLEALGRRPKPAAATAALLERAGLLGGRRGLTAAEFVKRRMRLSPVPRTRRRSRKTARARLSGVGTWIWLLKETYRELMGVLSPPPLVPEDRHFWIKRAQRWRQTGPRFRAAFCSYCKGDRLRHDAEALGRFEGYLADAKQRGGDAAVREAVRILTPSRTTPPTSPPPRILPPHEREAGPAG